MYLLVRRLLLFVVAFTLPLQAFSLVETGFKMTPFKLATALLLGVSALSFARGRRRQPDPVTPWIAIFAVTYAVSAVQGFLRGVPPGPIIQASVTFYAILLYYLLISYVIVTREDLMAVLWGLVLGGAVSAFPSVFGLQETSRGRAHGLAGQANTFGISLVSVTVVAIALFMVSRSRIKRAVLTGVVAAAVGGIMLSLSRTAFVCSLAIWGFWLFRSGRIDTLRYVVPAALVLAGALLLAPSTVFDRFDTMVDPARRARDGSIQGRLRQAELGAKALLTNPLIGIGVLAYIPWANSQPEGRDVRNVIHNAYVGIAVDQGLLGLIPYLMILFLCWRLYGSTQRMVRARRGLKDPVLTELGTLAMFLQLALFGSILSGLAGMAHKNKITWLLLSLAPVLYNFVKVRAEELQAGRVQEGEAPMFETLRADAPSWSR